MPIQVRCGECNQVLSVPDELIGKQVKCSNCQKVLKIPARKPTGNSPAKPAQPQAEEIRVTCECGKSIKAPASMFGKKGKCPRCSKIFVVPGMPPNTGHNFSDPQANLPADPDFDQPFDPTFDDPFAIPDDPLGLPPSPQLSPAAYSKAKKPKARRRSTASRSSGNPLMVPAIFMIVFSSLSILMFIISTIGNVFVFFAIQEEIRNNPAMQGEAAVNTGRIVGQLFSAVLGLITNGLIIAGAISMTRLENFSQARTASIIGMIPCCTGCVILGMPFAIWSFVLLSNPDIARRFRG